MTPLTILLAVVTQTVGSVGFYKCEHYSITHSPEFSITCYAGKVIVESAIIGASDQYKAEDNTDRPSQCSITNNTCTDEIMVAAELCTGRNSCSISQEQLLYNESNLLCPQSNWIGINYSCIIPDISNYGDICHFEGSLYANSPVYISSFPNFPNAIDNNTDFRCYCSLSTDSTLSVDVSVRALLVKLPGFSNCSEKLTIYSRGENVRTFCSPNTSVNDITTVSLSSARPALILFERGSSVSPNNGKFMLEIAGISSKTSSLGKIRCGLIQSTTSSFKTVTSTSSLYTPSTMTSDLLSHTSTEDQNTLSGTTLRSSFLSLSVQEKTSPSKGREASLESTSEDFETSTAPLTSAGVHSDNGSLSSGAIVGIVLGVFGFLTLIAIIIILLLRRSRKRQQYSKGKTDITVQQSVTVIQNMQTINNIELHEVVSPGPQTFQPEANCSNRRHTEDYDNFCQTEDNSLPDYEEGAPVSDALYGPGFGLRQANRSFENKTASKANRVINYDNESTKVNNGTVLESKGQTYLYDEGPRREKGPTTETQLHYTEDSDLTVVDNQIYDRNENPVSLAIESDDYDVAREVIQDRKTEESAEVSPGYAFIETKKSPADHWYYNMVANAGNGTAQPSVGVSAEAETNSASDKIEATNPILKADHDLVVIDNTLYGSLLAF